MRKQAYKALAFLALFLSIFMLSPFLILIYLKIWNITSWLVIIIIFVPLSILEIYIYKYIHNKIYYINNLSNILIKMNVDDAIDILKIYQDWEVILIYELLLKNDNDKVGIIVNELDKRGYIDSTVQQNKNSIIVDKLEDKKNNEITLLRNAIIFEPFIISKTPFIIKNDQIKLAKIITKDAKKIIYINYLNETMNKKLEITTVNYKTWEKVLNESGVKINNDTGGAGSGREY